jgi:hypothetical protein
MQKPNRSATRPGWRRRLAALLTSLIAGLPAAQTQTQTPPQHWLDYAQSTGDQFQAWLRDGSSGLVVRLHAGLERRETNDRLMGTAVPVIVQVWISAQGWVERVEFESLGDPQADADLRALLSRQPLSTPPPADMRQPLVLQLTLDSSGDDGAGAQAPASAQRRQER